MNLTNPTSLCYKKQTVNHEQEYLRFERPRTLLSDPGFARKQREHNFRSPCVVGTWNRFQWAKGSLTGDLKARSDGRGWARFLYALWQKRWNIWTHEIFSWGPMAEKMLEARCWYWFMMRWFMMRYVLGRRVSRQNKCVFESVVVVAFHSEKHVNNIILFFKNHFWNQHIKIIWKHQKILIFKKNLIFLKSIFRPQCQTPPKPAG